MAAIRGRDQGIAATPRALRRLAGLSAMLAVLAILTLTGCAMDREAAVRAQGAEWVVLGDTIAFKSTSGCTAGVFEAKRIKSSVKTVQDIERGLHLVGKGSVVAFNFPDMSPAEVQGALDSHSRRVGLAMLTSGLAARDCLPDDLQEAFSNALHAGDVTMIFDPATRAMVLFEPGEKRIFYTRGLV